MNMIKIGPVGAGYGAGGTIWDEKGRDQVAGFLISYNENAILSLQFLYYENDNFVLSKRHGGADNGFNDHSAIVFDYPSDFLTSISGSSEKVGNGKPVLTSIKFGTNKGSYGPFGTPKITTEPNNIADFDFQIGNHRLFGGFHGTENYRRVQSIGVYLKTQVNDQLQ
ncbi:inactive protein RESTRICTED TEV MOVEMENT 1-like [Nicotiana tomentosiformis]|uniref:inactive protein RESTRICTED TEV MOVEMENT 1-like n=1 Tax=Nicotiana tomentosiformis TaxID=4098 RepID=UPI00051ABD95|nr:inactive protein RESTRICTED TEV MOVEMENT 1-like [Nicotiana tomentosiformis]